MIAGGLCGQLFHVWEIGHSLFGGVVNGRLVSGLDETEIPWKLVKFWTLLMFMLGMYFLFCFSSLFWS